MKFIVLLGRFFFSWTFISTIFTHFSSEAAQHAAAAGVPMASLLVPVSAVIAFLGGVSILFGYKARIGAWLIVLFLVPVTLTMHRWWGVTDPVMRQMQHVNFHKNLAMIGAAMMIAYFGSGPMSIDAFAQAKGVKNSTA